METLKEFYGKGRYGELPRVMYNPLEVVVQGVMERKPISYNPLENIIGKEKRVGKTFYYHNPL